MTAASAHEPPHPAKALHSYVRLSIQPRSWDTYRKHTERVIYARQGAISVQEADEKTEIALRYAHPRGPCAHANDGTVAGKGTSQLQWPGPRKRSSHVRVRSRYPHHVVVICRGEHERN